MKRNEVKHIFQKILMAIVIFSLIYPWNLWAARKGARVTITRLDGTAVEGRLLKVEEDSLLIKAITEGITININEIDSIRVNRKEKRLERVLSGLVVGGAAGGAIAYHKYKYNWYNVYIIGGATVIGALLGVSIGSSTSKSKTFRIKGMTQYEIKFILRKLKKKARFRK